MLDRWAVMNVGRIGSMGLFFMGFFHKEEVLPLNNIIVHIPHASEYIPSFALSDYDPVVLKTEKGLMTDRYTDELFAFPCERVVFPFSRLFCDVERFRNDDMEDMSKIGMGAVYTATSQGEKLREITDDFKMHILREYYDPHHKRLEKSVGAALNESGECLVLDGHSFHPVPLPYEPDQTPGRPDICIGTDSYHTPEKLTDMICTFWRDEGYSVATNRPYGGALVPMRYYGKNRNVHAVMIEINRGLYLDKDGGENDRLFSYQGFAPENVFPDKRCILIQEKGEVWYMRLIFIRHGEPDYQNDTLTEKGFREAELLAERTKNWRNIKSVYVSPLPRAQYTADPTLKALGMTGITLDWMREFGYPIDRELHPRKLGFMWDLTPAYYMRHSELFDINHWAESEIPLSGNIRYYYDMVTGNFDKLLAEYGYVRDGLTYRSDPEHVPSNAHQICNGHTIENMKNREKDYTEDNLVFFAHFGVNSIVISHLINCSPYVLLNGDIQATSAVTVLIGEESEPGFTNFRIQVLGDTSHLRFAEEPVSYYGAFAPVFQQ